MEKSKGRAFSVQDPARFHVNSTPLRSSSGIGAAILVSAGLFLLPVHAQPSSESPALEAPAFLVPLPPDDVAEIVSDTLKPGIPEAPAKAEETVAAKPADPVTEPQAEPVTDVVVPLPPDITEEVAANFKVAPTEPTKESAAAPATEGTSSAQADIVLDLPALPEVVVSFDTPRTLAAEPVRLATDVEQLRAMIEPLRARYRLTPAQADGMVDAYVAREFRAFWLDPKGEEVHLSDKAAALIATLAKADEDGLDATRLLSALPTQRKGAVAPDARIEADIRLSLAAYLYAHDARGGRLEPSRLSSLLTPQLSLPAAGEVLEKVAAVQPRDIEAGLQTYQPPHAGYRALRKALAKLREEMAAPVLTGSVAGMSEAPLPIGGLPANWLEGAPLAFDKPDPRVASLRLRLGLPANGGNVYDAETREAVVHFQRANDLTPNGRITPKTRAALENPRAPLTEADRKPDRHVQMAAILANMERWRWLPAELGETHVFVNVADYSLNLVSKRAVIHETRVIVGKPQTQTPIFSDEIEHLIVNPSWHVPPSILKKEFLPAMAKDPDYAAKRGYEVVRRGKSISIRQPPGERNALGNVKFMFPNSHSVYLHDTPNRNLFSSEARAFSHGCVRVDKPFAFAEKLLQADLGLTEPQLRAMVGRGERMLKLNRRIPVHLAYFTVSVDENGEIRQRRDIYGHDARLASALQF